MKKILAFQGSPREKGNTSRLINEVLKGSQEKGAETELIYISSLKMTVCRGCYSCKRRGATFGKCFLKDDMRAIYDKIDQADAVIFGSPVYMCGVTPELKMVIDRLFPYLTMNLGSTMKKNKKCLLIFTQNQKEEKLFENLFNTTSYMLKLLGFEEPQILLSSNTIGYTDKDLENMDGDNILEVHQEKLTHRSINEKKELQTAYAIGQKLAE